MMMSMSSVAMLLMMLVIKTHMMTIFSMHMKLMTMMVI